MNSISCSKGTGSKVASLDRRVGGADERMAVPGDGEHDAAVAGVRHHDGGVAGQEGAVEDEVGALAGRDHRRRIGIGQTAHGIGEGAGGIDDDFRLRGEIARRSRASCDDDAVRRSRPHPL